MIKLLLAGALATAPLQDPAAQAGPVTLEDVTVTGRPLERMIQDFVGEVAEPNRRRGLARWEGDICVGVANLRPEAAQYLADRISTVAEDLGLSPGAPGCTPDVLVVATDDAGGLARALVGERRRAFRMGVAGMDRGGDALEDFVETERPVRWWQMALPVDAETGARATRIAGDCEGPTCGGGNWNVMAFAPQVEVFSASRLRSQVVDNLIRAVVIVDVDELKDVTILQLADYIAMVSLAQIDPDADTSGYASILNVFDDPASADHLMDWDMAYLGGLYAAERNARSRLTNRQEIVDSIHDAHGQLQDARADREPDGGEGVSN